MSVVTPNKVVVTRRELRSALRKFRKGEISKTGIERGLGITNARGKWITRAWYVDLGEKTGNSVLV